MSLSYFLFLDYLSFCIELLGLKYARNVHFDLFRVAKVSNLIIDDVFYQGFDDWDALQVDHVYFT